MPYLRSMVLRRVPHLLAVLLTLAVPARAEQRVLVVPEGAIVAVPARGVVGPARPAAPQLAPPRARRARLPPPEPASTTVPIAVGLLPLAAAAALAAGLASGGGGSGGVSAPVRTR